MKENVKDQKILEVNVGDKVFLRNVAKPGEPKKLQAPFEGPYRVLS